MKYILFFLVFLLCNAYLNAQEALDVITMKNGTIYKGTLAEYVPDGKTVMILVDGRTVEMNSTEILSLHEAKNRAHFSNNKGFTHSSSIGFLLQDTGGGIEANFQYNMINGYRLKQWVLGAGTGVEILRFNMSTPLFLNLSYDFKQGRTTPYIAGQLGRTRNWGHVDGSSSTFGLNQFKSGNLAGLNLGIRHSFTSDLGLILSAGYRYYDLRGTYTEREWTGGEWLEYEVNAKTFLHRFNMSVGLIFN